MAFEFFVAFVASVVTAFYLVTSRRRRFPQLKLDSDALPEISHALPQIVGLTGGSLQGGNSAAIFQNGAMLDRLAEAISQAEHTIHFQTYVWTKGKMEDRFTELFCKKSREGVRVRVLLDAVGASRASRKNLDALRKNGVDLAFYHPITRVSLRRFNNRNHRKLVVVDGSTGFVFGHGIDDRWTGSAEDKDHWRDTGISLIGPIVCYLQTIFAQDWIETSQRPPMEQSCFMSGEHQGRVTAHLVSSSQRGGFSSVALLYMLAIVTAREEIVIQNPYFAPNQSVPVLLERAVKRGVSVHLTVPGSNTDSPLLRRAGQHLYERLLKAGVHIYEYEKSFIHQKVVVVDRVWSHIGSTNFDSRSLLLNAEIGVGLLDKSLAQQLLATFEQDLAGSHELTLKEWKARPWYHQAFEFCAYQLHGQV